MKAQRIIWPVLLGITSLACWLTIPRPQQVRIRIGPDMISDVSTSSAPAIVYDPYFTPVNIFTKILIPAGKPK
jgi:hypothetical protein